MPSVIAVGHHCQLLAQGKHLEMERGPAPQEVGQGGEQRNEYCFHSGNATRAQTEKPTKSISTVFLVGTVRFLHPPAVCHERLADVAVCVDPDGTLIEILQVYLDRWGPFLG